MKGLKLVTLIKEIGALKDTHVQLEIKYQWSQERVRELEAEVADLKQQVG